MKQKQMMLIFMKIQKKHITMMYLFIEIIDVMENIKKNYLQIFMEKNLQEMDMQILYIMKLISMIK